MIVKGKSSVAVDQGMDNGEGCENSIMRCTHAPLQGNWM